MMLQEMRCSLVLQELDQDLSFTFSPGSFLATLEEVNIVSQHNLHCRIVVHI